jgi:hypothetical protein
MESHVTLPGFPGHVHSLPCPALGVTPFHHNRVLVLVRMDVLHVTWMRVESMVVLQVYSLIKPFFSSQLELDSCHAASPL